MEIETQSQLKAVDEKINDKIKKLLERDAKQKEYQRKQYEKNKDKIIAKVKAYNETHKEDKLKHDREYYQKNKEKQEANSANYYKRLRSFYEKYIDVHRDEFEEEFEKNEI